MSAAAPASAPAPARTCARVQTHLIKLLRRRFPLSGLRSIVAIDDEDEAAGLASPTSGVASGRPRGAPSDAGTLASEQADLRSPAFHDHAQTRFIRVFATGAVTELVRYHAPIYVDAAERGFAAPPLTLGTGDGALAGALTFALKHAAHVVLLFQAHRAGVVEAYARVRARVEGSGDFGSQIQFCLAPPVAGPATLKQIGTADTNAFDGGRSLRSSTDAVEVAPELGRAVAQALDCAARSRGVDPARLSALVATPLPAGATGWGGQRQFQNPAAPRMHQQQQQQSGFAQQHRAPNEPNVWATAGTAAGHDDEWLTAGREKQLQQQHLQQQRAQQGQGTPSGKSVSQVFDNIPASASVASSATALPSGAGPAASAAKSVATLEDLSESVVAADKPLWLNPTAPLESELRRAEAARRAAEADRRRVLAGGGE